jgi:hypothetical protein
LLYKFDFAGINLSIHGSLSVRHPDAEIMLLYGVVVGAIVGPTYVCAIDDPAPLASTSIV